MSTVNPGYEIYKLGRMYTRYFVAVTRHIGRRIYPEHWLILDRLYNGAELAPTQLLSPSVTGMAGLTRTLDTMERRGWIRRRRDARDRRRTQVSLTKKGIKVRDEIFKLAKKNRPGLNDGLSAYEMTDFSRLIRRFEANLERALQEARLSKPQKRRK